MLNKNLVYHKKRNHWAEHKIVSYKPAVQVNLTVLWVWSSPQTGIHLHILGSESLIKPDEVLLIFVCLESLALIQKKIFSLVSGGRVCIQRSHIGTKVTRCTNTTFTHHYQLLRGSWSVELLLFQERCVLLPCHLIQFFIPVPISKWHNFTKDDLTWTNLFKRLLVRWKIPQFQWAAYPWWSSG